MYEDDNGPGWEQQQIIEEEWMQVEEEKNFPLSNEEFDRQFRNHFDREV
ncbi:MAG: hypothetical protein QXL17_02955 [Candidatus Thermoplasmatota archaeon]